MRFIERVRNLDGDLQGLIWRQRLACKTSIKGLALEVLHDEEIDIALRAHVVKNTDIGMLQAGDGFCLALETGAQFRAGVQVGRENLDGDGALEARVAGAVYLSHAARTDGGLYFVRP
jgi:hypothetical protein